MTCSVGAMMRQLPEPKANPLPLGEESRLSRCVLGVAKVAQTNSDEAKTLLSVQANTVSE